MNPFKYVVQTVKMSCFLAAAIINVRWLLVKGPYIKDVHTRGGGVNQKRTRGRRGGSEAKCGRPHSWLYFDKKKNFSPDLAKFRSFIILDDWKVY